jgi:RimJ/RimL family protein N-acetyltransferase
LRDLTVSPAGPASAAGGQVVAERIVTDRLELVPLRCGDAEEMQEVLADDRLYEFTGGTALGLFELRRRYCVLVAGSQRSGETWLNWIVRLGSSKGAIGTVQATIVPGPDAGRVAEVSWVIGTAWQGRGFASEAALALRAFLEAEGIGEIRALIDPRHDASAGVARHAGLHMTPEVIDGECLWRND